MKEGLTEIKVRGYHLDLYQHVNNARYLEFLEEARWELFEKTLRGEYLKNQGLAFIIVNININYRWPAALGDTLQIKTQLKEIGQKSVVLLQQVFNKETQKCLTDAEVTFVLVDGQTGKSIKLDQEVLYKMGLTDDH